MDWTAPTRSCTRSRSVLGTRVSRIPRSWLVLWRVSDDERRGNLQKLPTRSPQGISVRRRPSADRAPAVSRRLGRTPVQRHRRPAAPPNRCTRTRRPVRTAQHCAGQCPVPSTATQRRSVVSVTTTRTSLIQTLQTCAACPERALRPRRGRGRPAIGASRRLARHRAQRPQALAKGHAHHHGRRLALYSPLLPPPHADLRVRSPARRHSRARRAPASYTDRRTSTCSSMDPIRALRKSRYRPT